MKKFLTEHFQLLSGLFSLTMNPKLVERTPHPGPLPIGSADSADAEREKRSQSSCKTTAEFSRVIHEFYEIIQRLFPLLWGEGQGEGKADLACSGFAQMPPALKLCATP